MWSRSVSVLAIVAGMSVQSCSRAEDAPPAAGPTAVQPDSEETAYYTAADFASVAKRDSHVHINTSDASFVEQAKDDNFDLITVNVDTPRYPSIDEQQALAVAHAAAFPRRVAFAATISVKNFTAPQWKDAMVARLTEAFNKGAIAVKFWKNIGMELKSEEGAFVMIDDPKFDSIFEFIARNKTTVIGHIGEPKNCWLPLSDMTTNNDRDYYTAHPEYHMYQHPDYPTYEQQVQARDRMLSRHPDLTFVGAHLGSLEWSTDQLAARLDAFPKLAVDMAARIAHLQYQTRIDHEKVRHFFLKYQDRLIYGTDQAIGPRRDPAAVRERAHEIWTRDWRFLATDDTLQTPEVNGAFKGLKLPRQVIDKVYRLNAERWFPGLKAGD